MKKTFKYLTLSGLGGLLCLFLAIPADAQRGSHGGGGGGGFHGGGGGGFHGGGGSSFHGGGGFSGGGFRGGSSASVRSSAGFGGGGRVMATPQGRSYAAPTNRGAYAGGRNMVTSRGAYVGGNGVTRISGGGRAYVGGRAYAGGYGRSYYGGYRGGYYGPWGYHGGFYYNRGFYSSLYYPRLGFSLGYLPYGYYPFWWGDSEFYYSNGFYYNYDGGQYTVVEPPVGAAINTLPSGAQSIVINGQQYYELNGVYYQPITKDDGTVVYQIAGKDGQLQTNDGGQVSQGYNDQGTYNDNGDVQTHPNPRMGDMIQDLPQDSRRVRVNGQVLYVTPDDVYLKQTKDADGNRAYVVVGLPNGNE